MYFGATYSLLMLDCQNPHVNLYALNKEIEHAIIADFFFYKSLNFMEDGKLNLLDSFCSSLILMDEQYDLF